MFRPVRPPVLPVATVAVGLGLLLSACSREEVTEPPGPGPQQIEIASSTPPAGGAVEILGLDLDPGELESLVVEVGGQRQVLYSNGAGDVFTTVPVRVDEDLHFLPFDGPLDVVLRGPDGRVLAELPEALEPTQPVPAPGTSERAVAALSGYLAATRRAFELAPPEPGIEEQAVVALLDLLDWMVEGDSELSLSTQLAALSEDELAVIDALWNASSLVDELEGRTEFSEETTQLLERTVAFGAQASPGFAATGSAAQLPRSLGPAVAIELDDAELAAMMQSVEIRRLYGQYVIHGTSDDFGGWPSALAGAIAIFPPAALLGPVSGTISFVLALLDFIINKHLIALEPTRIDYLELEIADSELETGDTTESSKRIRVTNDPPEITLHDFIEQTLNLFGLYSPDGLDWIEESTLLVTSLISGQANSYLADYASSHPEYETMVGAYHVPHRSWTAVLDDPRFLELKEVPAGDVVVDESGLEWRVVSEEDAEAEVWIQPAIGPDAVLYEPRLGIEYTGGAFGVDIVPSERVTLEVSSKLKLEVHMAESIAPGGTNALEVRAGYRNESGEIEYLTGVAVELQVVGGSAADESGLTDEDGQFITLVTIERERPEVEVRITAQDGKGNRAEETRIAVVAESNLIANPGNDEPLESGISGWIAVLGNDWKLRSSDPPPQSGPAYFFAGVSASAELAQEVDLSSFRETIDAGVQKFTFSGYTRGWHRQADASRIVAEYRGGGGEVLALFDTGPQTVTTRWLLHRDVRTAPVGTRSVRVRLIATRAEGSNNDGYFDSLFLAPY